MTYKIKQLYDYRKNRPVKLKDVDKSKFEDKESFEVDGETYRVWKYEQRLIEDDYVKDKTLWKGDLEDSPVNIYTNVGGHLVIKNKKLSKNLYEKYGEGRIMIKHFGGDKDINYPFKNRFIEKIEEEED